MHLAITTNKGLRHLNLDRSFFQTSHVKKGHLTVTMTPTQKARELVHDLEGGNVVSYELYNEDKLITKYERDNIRNSQGEVLPTRSESMQRRSNFSEKKS